MCTLSELKFLHINLGGLETPKKLLVVSANLELSPSGFSYNFTNPSKKDTYFIGTAEFYKFLPPEAKKSPVTKNNIFWLDHCSGLVCVMPAKRSNNHFGDIIPNSVLNKMGFSEIVIPESNINPEAEYYVEMINYPAFSLVSTIELKKRLINEDLLAFGTRYSNLSINLIISNQVGKFIATNFTKEEIPANIKLCYQHEKDLIHRCMDISFDVKNACESIFGKIITRENTTTQGDLFFRVGRQVLSPLFVAQTASNIVWLLKKKSVQYTGQGSSRLFAVLSLNTTEEVDGMGQTASSEELVDSEVLKITNEHGAIEYFSGDYSTNTDYESFGISSMIDRLLLVIGLNKFNSSKTYGQMKTFIDENISKITSIMMEPAVEQSDDEITIDHHIISSQINLFKQKIKEIMIGFFNDVSENSAKRKVRFDSGIGGIGQMGQMGGMCQMGGIGTPIMPLQNSAGLYQHTALGREYSATSITGVSQVMADAGFDY